MISLRVASGRLQATPTYPISSAEPAGSTQYLKAHPQAPPQLLPGPGLLGPSWAILLPLSPQGQSPSYLSGQYLTPMLPGVVLLTLVNKDTGLIPHLLSIPYLLVGRRIQHLFLSFGERALKGLEANLPGHMGQG